MYIYVHIHMYLYMLTYASLSISLSLSVCLVCDFVCLCVSLSLSVSIRLSRCLTMSVLFLLLSPSLSLFLSLFVCLLASLHLCPSLAPSPSGRLCRNQDEALDTGDTQHPWFGLYPRMTRMRFKHLEPSSKASKKRHRNRSMHLRPWPALNGQVVWNCRCCG